MFHYVRHSVYSSWQNLFTPNFSRDFSWIVITNKIHKQSKINYDPLFIVNIERRNIVWVIAAATWLATDLQLKQILCWDIGNACRIFIPTVFLQHLVPKKFSFITCTIYLFPYFKTAGKLPNMPSIFLKNNILIKNIPFLWGPSFFLLHLSVSCLAPAPVCDDSDVRDHYLCDGDHYSDGPSQRDAGPLSRWHSSVPHESPSPRDHDERTRVTPGSCYAARSSEAQPRPRARPLSGGDRAGGRADTSHQRGAGTGGSWPLQSRAPGTWSQHQNCSDAPHEALSIWDTNINFAHSFNAVVPKVNGIYLVIYGGLQSSNEKGWRVFRVSSAGKYPIKMVTNAFRGSRRQKIEFSVSHWMHNECSFQVPTDNMSSLGSE